MIRRLRFVDCAWCTEGLGFGGYAFLGAGGGLGYSLGLGTSAHTGVVGRSQRSYQPKE